MDRTNLGSEFSTEIVPTYTQLSFFYMGDNQPQKNVIAANLSKFAAVNRFSTVCNQLKSL